MFKSLLMAAIVLSSVSSFAALTELNADRATTYRQGIHDLIMDQYTARVNKGLALDCGGNELGAMVYVVDRADQVLLDPTGAEPVVQFVRNPNASGDGERRQDVYVRTNAAHTVILSVTRVQTDFERKLVNKDVMNLQYGIVQTPTTTVCDLTK